MGKISRQSIAENLPKVRKGQVFPQKNGISPLYLVDKNVERVGLDEFRKGLRNEKSVDEGGGRHCRLFAI